VPPGAVEYKNPADLEGPQTSGSLGHQAVGCMSMSFGYGLAGDQQEMISLIRSAVETGLAGRRFRFV